jgi:phosphoserine phosphatase
VVQLAAAELGAAGAFDTRCHVVDGVHTGEVATTLHTPTGKGDLVACLEARHGPPLFAFGDSSGDVPMLERARHPICVASSRPRPGGAAGSRPTWRGASRS